MVFTLDDAGPGSLRQAILDTPSGGTVDFQPGLTGTIVLTTGELAIAEDLTINGPGASSLTVSGNNASRVFNIAASFTVTLAGLTIADGRVTGTVAQGGGIFNAGSLTVTACTLRDNAATGGSGSAGSGGAIYSAAGAGTLVVIASALSYNSATGGVNAGAGSGGAIYSAVGAGGAGTLTVTASSLSYNSATGGTASSRAGAGIGGASGRGGRPSSPALPSATTPPLAAAPASAAAAASAGGGASSAPWGGHGH